MNGTRLLVFWFCSIDEEVSPRNFGCRLALLRALGPSDFLPSLAAMLMPSMAFQLIFTALALHPLNVLAVAVDFRLIAVDLLLLLIVGIFMTL